MAEPLRVLSMHDWGYGSEVLGAVASLQWAPDNLALAVRPSADKRPVASELVHRES